MLKTMGDHCCKPRVVIPLCLLLNIVLDVAVGFPELFSADTVVSRNSVHRNAFPLQVVFIPDGSGRFLLASIDGKVYIGDPNQLSVPTEVYLDLTPYVFAKDEVGLLSILCDRPAVWGTSDARVFVYWTRPEGTRISSFLHVENDGLTSSRATYASEEELWVDTDGLPGVDNAQYKATGVLWHYGGELQWGPDHRLYLSLGDKQKADWVEMPDKYSGCILRINRDGSIPEGNLDPSVKPAECWAQGARNGFRAYWDLKPVGQERYFVGEVGGNNHATASEDLHVISAREHLGWPACEGNCSDNPMYSTCDCELHDNPIYTYLHRGQQGCIVAGFTYRGTALPQEYRGAFFFGDYSRQTLSYLTFEADGSETVRSVHSFGSTATTEVSGNTGPVYITEAPDGSIWYIENPTRNWRIRRISYTGDVNAEPVFTHFEIASGASGTAPLTTTFIAAATDDDGDTLTYTWLFGDGTQYQTTVAGEAVTHTYVVRGYYFTRCIVSDGQGASTQSEYLQVTCGIEPELTILSPIPESVFTGSDIIQLQASAADDIDGDLSERIVWSFEFIHDNHTHPQGETPIGAHAELPVPISGHSYEGFTGLLIKAQVQDSHGLVDEKEVYLWPTKRPLIVQTTPLHTFIFDDGVQLHSPHVTEDMIGYVHYFSVATDVCDPISGIQYTFDRWSTGELEATLAYPVPDETNASLTALYTATGTCESILYRVNCAGPALIDANGDAWISDTPFAVVSGNTIKPSQHVAAHTHTEATDPAYLQFVEVFETERYTGNFLRYEFPVEHPGFYKVETLTTEHWHGAGVRGWDIEIEGEIVFAGIDLSAEDGFQVLTSRIAIVEITSAPGDIDIRYIRDADKSEGPAVYGIRISKINDVVEIGGITSAPTTPIVTSSPTATAIGTGAPTSAVTGSVVHRINCAGPTVTDSDGHVWMSDTSLVSGESNTINTWTTFGGISYTGPTALMTKLEVFKTERWSKFSRLSKPGIFQYSLPVTEAGTYRVDVLMAENWHEGERRFSVELQGQTVFENIDLYAEEGMHVMAMRSSDVHMAIDTGNIDIRFIPNPAFDHGPPIYGLRVTLLDSESPTSPAPSVATGTPTLAVTGTPTSAVTGTPTLAVTGTPTSVVTASPSTSAAVSEGEIVYQINCGGPDVMDDNGNVWSSDASLVSDGSSTVNTWGFFGGIDYSGPPEFFAYVDMFKTERWSKYARTSRPGDFSYTLPVALAGSYRVEVFMAENWHSSVGVRLFSVELQGETVFPDIDLYAEDGLNVMTARASTATVATAGGSINIRFIPNKDTDHGVALYGLRITRLVDTASVTDTPTHDPMALPPTTAMPTTATGAPTTAAPSTDSPPAEAADTLRVLKRINCGGPDVVDTLGHVWESDSTYSPGGKTVKPATIIPVHVEGPEELTSLVVVYDTERWSKFRVGDLDYTIAVPAAGVYYIDLLLCEMWHEVIGKRVFDIEIQGQVVVSALDLYETTGFQHLSSQRFEVAVPETALNIHIRFKSRTDAQEGPAVYAISLSEEVPIVETAPPVDPPPMAAGDANVVTHRINCGGVDAVDASGHYWQSDSDIVSGGNVAFPGEFAAIDFTLSNELEPLETLLDVERWAHDMTYLLPVNLPGTYEVEILTVESLHPEAGVRVFSIDLQGVPTHTNIDLATTYGFQTAASLMSRVVVSPEHNGVLRIRFYSVAGSDAGATVSAIKVSLVGTTTVYSQINCGGPAVSDLNGDAWVSDVPYVVSGKTVQPSDHRSIHLVGGSAVLQYLPIFDTERYATQGRGSLEFHVPITPSPNPELYTVSLLFLESWHDRVGVRVMDVYVEDDKVIPALDVYALAGREVPLVADLTVRKVAHSTSIYISIAYSSGSEPPAIYGIRVSKISAAAASTSAPTIATPSPSVAVPTVTSPPVSGPVDRAADEDSIVMHRITCGGDSGADYDGNVWQSDSMFITSATSVSSVTQQRTVFEGQYTTTELQDAFEFVFESERHGTAGNDITYEIPVLLTGTYEIEVFAVEADHESGGVRVFSIDVQGETMKSDVDLVIDYGFQVGATISVRGMVRHDDNGLLRLRLHGSTGSPTISAIRVTLVEGYEIEHYRINCGGPNVSDTSGKEWESDVPYVTSPGAGVRTVADPHTVTMRGPLATLYGANIITTERYSAGVEGTIEYHFPVPGAGLFAIDVLYTEFWHTSEGQRDFWIRVQSETVNNVDVVAEGGTHSPVLRRVLAQVGATAGGAPEDLVVTFGGYAGVDGPIINAISVVSLHQAS